MKILFLLSHYFEQCSGSSEYQAYLLAKHASVRHSVAHTYVETEYGWSAEACGNIKLYIISKPSLARRILGQSYALDYFKIMKLIRKIHPDIIYMNIGLAYLGIAAHYTRNTNCKLIWHIASEMDVQPFKFRLSRNFLLYFVDKKVLEYGIRNADRIIGQANYQNELLKKNYSRECDLIVPNFHPSPREKIHKFKLPIVVWVSNFKSLKQPELFLALAQKLRGNPGTRFIMIGREGAGRYQASLEKRINDLDNLEYLRECPIDEVNRILALSHIFVNTSRYEGFPNTFIQAWLREVPVVSLNVDPDDILVRECIGFHSKTFEQLVLDVQRLLDDTTLRNKMGLKAREYASEHHTFEKNTSKILELMSKSIIS